MPPLTPIARAMAGAIALLSSSAITTSQAANRTWDAGCNTNDWNCVYTVPFSSPPLGTTNWNGLNNLPTNGDSLIFAGSSGLTNTNTFANLSIANLSFASNAGAFVLNGNALTVTGNISNGSATNGQTINAPIRIGGNQVWTGGSAGLSFGNLSFTGTTARTVTGSGKITLTGNLSNDSSALQTINAPVIIGADQTWNAGSGGLVLGGGLSFASGSAPRTVTGSGSITLNGGIANASSNLQTLAASLFVGATQTWNLGTGGLSVGGIGFAPGLPANALTLAGSGPLVSKGSITNDSGNAQTLGGSIVVGSSQVWSGGAGGLAVVTPSTEIGGTSSALTLRGAGNRHDVTQLAIGTGGSYTVTDSAVLNLGTRSPSGQRSGGLNGASGSGSLVVDRATLNLLGTNFVVHSFFANGTVSALGDGQLLSTQSTTLGELSNLSCSVCTFTQTGGTHSTSHLSLPSYVYVLSGGTLNVSNTLLMGNSTFRQSGGTLNAAVERLGYSGTATFAQTGGTHNVGDLQLGAGSSIVRSNYQLSGGVLNIGAVNNGVASGGISDAGSSTTSTFSFTGGSLNLLGTSISVDNFTMTNAQLALGSGKSFAVGTLGIQAGATFTSGVGPLSFQSATVSGLGASWQNTASLGVGSAGHSRLTVSNLGTLTAESSFIGRDAGTEGTASVLSGGAWSTFSYLSVGSAGIGTLNVGAGGTVSVGAATLIGTLHNEYSPLAGSGAVTVAGANARLTSGYLIVGRQAPGTLTIRDQGSVISDFGYIDIHDKGVVNLQAGGTLRLESVNLLPGGQFNWTGGTLHFNGIGGIDLGESQLGQGMVFDLKAGRTLRVDDRLQVGNKVLLLSGGALKTGSLRLDGGLIAATAGQALDAADIGHLSGFGTIHARIAGGAGATISADGGTLSLGDLGAVGGFAHRGTLQIGGQQVALHAADRAQLGSLTTLDTGGQLSAIHGATLGAGGVLSFSGNATVLGDFSNNGLVSGSGGTLTFLNDVDGAGSYAGNIVFRAGFAPGNSPATVDHGGSDLTFDPTSVLTMEIFGPAPGTQYDQLVGIRQLSFNGRLSLVFADGFVPAAGSVFSLFAFESFAGSLASDRIDVAGFDRTRLDFSQLAQSGSFQVAAVPEPGSYVMFAAGLGLMACIARRRRSGAAA